MGNIFSNIIAFFNKNMGLYIATVFTLIGIFGVGISKLELINDVYSIFPKNEQFKKYGQILKDQKINNRIFFSIEAEGKDDERVLEEVDSIYAVLKSSFEEELIEFQVFNENIEEKFFAHFYSIFPSLLDSTDYSTIEEKLSLHNIEKSIQEVKSKSIGFQSFFYKKLISHDPLGISIEKLALLSNKEKLEDSFIKNGLIYVQEGRTVLFSAKLNFDTQKNEENIAFNIKLNKFKQDINERNAELGFMFFGTFQIFNDNIVQVKHDTFLTLIIGISLILLIIFIYFRKVIIPIIFLFPGVLSAFISLGLIGYIKGSISALSLSTSAVLIGIVLDYSFHFFTHYKESKSLTETVKSISNPMIIGSFTTIAAFAALLFTNSSILQDFGLLAVCVLSSSALITLILLPPFLNIIQLKFSPQRQQKKLNIKLPKFSFKILTLIISSATVFFVFEANNISFDSDLNNLSFHSESLKRQEALFTGLNPEQEKKIYIFSEGKNKDETLENNFSLYKRLKQQNFNRLVSVSPLLLSQKRMDSSYQIWKNFWASKKDSIQNEILYVSQKNGISKKAFLPFYNWIDGSSPSQDQVNNNLLSGLGLNDLIFKRDKKWTTITSVTLAKSDVNSLKESIKDLPSSYIFDTADLSNSLMDMVKKDLNYLLLFSSILVFLTLLLIYGRIELALFAFLPMLVSWIWIIGIAAELNLSFNFVNIIIATFIFGLGDDFSIFITDGLLCKYSKGEEKIKSYKTAIILSGLTTLAGTGALFFAKHPAIYSIAGISVLGISIILIISLFIQPYIFNVFVTNRVKKGLPPVVLTDILITFYIYTLFILGCLLAQLALLLLFITPLNKKLKTSLFTTMLSKMAAFLLFINIGTKTKLINTKKLDYSSPSLIVVNHTSFIDILIVLMLHPKTIIMVKEWVYNSILFGLLVRYTGYIFIGDDSQHNLEKLQRQIDDGYSLVVFPEGKRSDDGKINRFHKGAFLLAKELNLDIQPIYIHGAWNIIKKGDLLMRKGSIWVKAMDRISSDDALFNQRLGKIAQHFNHSLKKEAVEINKEHLNAKTIKKRIQNNYLYKGPILEWYIRIKLLFEEKNFDDYNTLIGNRKTIYDIGCGYGYLSYYLHYKDQDRTIKAIDYDHDKILIAKNGFDKCENLQFKADDARKLTIKNADVVILTDVLHYLTSEEQNDVLNHAIENLNENGILLVRDGITDLNKKRHQLTAKTERFSTKYLKFNKTTNDLSFFSADKLQQFAKDKKLQLEMIEQSNKTSNVLFIFKN